MTVIVRDCVVRPAVTTDRKGMGDYVIGRREPFVLSQSNRMSKNILILQNQSPSLRLIRDSLILLAPFLYTFTHILVTLDLIASQYALSLFPSIHISYSD